jgi:hypothetical protein
MKVVESKLLNEVGGSRTEEGCRRLEDQVVIYPSTQNSIGLACMQRQSPSATMFD